MSVKNQMVAVRQMPTVLISLEVIVAYVLQDTNWKRINQPVPVSYFKHAN